MKYVGIDPDTHATSFAIADLDRVYAVDVAKVGSKYRGADAVVQMSAAISETVMRMFTALEGPFEIYVEGQKVYSRQQRANPNAIVTLAQVAGAAINATQVWGPTELVLPQDWKQQQPKVTNQGRTYRHFGWNYTSKTPKRGDGYCIPQCEEAAKFKQSDSSWRHIADALGIALWAAKEAHKGQLRSKYAQ